jgi:hypothetical protein
LCLIGVGHVYRRRLALLPVKAGMLAFDEFNVAGGSVLAGVLLCAAAPNALLPDLTELQTRLGQQSVCPP